MLTAGEHVLPARAEGDPLRYATCVAHPRGREGDRGTPEIRTVLVGAQDGRGRSLLRLGSLLRIGARPVEGRGEAGV